MKVLVNIDVADLELAIAFYQAALPLRLSRRLFGDQVAELDGAGVRLYLLEQPAGSPAGGERRRYRRHWTPVHLDFVVDDIERAVRQARAAGARQESPLRHFSWGRLVTLSDPFGNGFCLVQFIGGPYQEPAVAMP
ncbi:glyoxalase [Zobellella endophytica]|uniref:Glyoxalase n=1 Tax=Zobellella endophytica TaxID=2116700 RepID=A0A2P7R2N3_9GAMM|nr:VOC family protein [Zobellella endophytica]PSJ44475.1 glyoxalase [Zobellella endophytica]